MISSFLTLKQVMISYRVCRGWSDLIGRVSLRSDSLHFAHHDLANLLLAPPLITRRITQLTRRRRVGLTPTELNDVRIGGGATQWILLHHPGVCGHGSSGCLGVTTIGTRTHWSAER